MYSHQRLLVTFLGLCCCLCSRVLVAQQFPVQAQVIVPQPIPTSSPEVLARTNQPVLVLINSDLFQDFDVMIGATITSNNGISARLDPLQKKPAKPIRIPRRGRITLTGDQIMAAYSNYSSSDISYLGITAAELANDQLFPEGAYTLCIGVFDFNSGQRLSDTPPLGCTPPMKVITPDPPVITYPLNNALLELTAFDDLIFRWSPTNISNAFVNYRIRIAKVPTGVNPYDALQNQNLLWWEEDNFSSTFYLYDISKPRFVDNTSYVVQVTAYDLAGNALIKNNGESEAILFRYKKTIPDPPSLISPANGSNLTVQAPQDYTFRWTDLSYGQLAIAYDFRLFEVPVGVAPEEVIDKPSLIVFEKTGLYSSSIQYDRFLPPLEPGKTYAWRVHAYDPGGQLGFNNNGYSTISTFQLTNPLTPAPIIENPQNGELVTLPSPKQLDIKWRHDFPPALNKAEYFIQLWETDEGQDPSEWMANKSPIFTHTTFSKSFVYGSNQPELKPGRVYLLLVQASSSQTTMANDGKSNLVVFRIEESPELPVHEIDLACGEGCNYTLPTDRDAVRTFVSGDILRLGNFLIRLTDESTLSGSSYRGKAEIVPGSFFQAPVAIELKGIRFNAAGIAFFGSADAILDTQVELPWSWTGNLGAWSLPDDPGTTVDGLERHAQEISSNSTQVLNLPLHFGGIYLTKLQLRPVTATATLVQLKKLEGDRQLNEKYALFAERNICFSAGGPAVEPADAFLPLAQLSLTIDRSASFDITLLRRAMGAPYGGTALPYTCAGAGEVHAAGYVTIVSDQLYQGDQPLSVSPLYGSFQTTFSDWLDWQAELTLTSASSRGQCCWAADPVELTHSEVPDMVFEIEELTLDHSAYSNPNDLQLPPGSNGPDQELLDFFPAAANLWSGIFIKKAYFKLPLFFEKPDQERLKFPAKDYVLDNYGFSGQSHLIIDQFFPAFHFQDWFGSFRGADIDIQANHLEEAKIHSTVRIPFFESDFPLTAENNWDGNRANWLLTFTDLREAATRIPAWTADVVLNRRDSRMYSVLNTDRTKMTVYTLFKGVLIFDTTIGNIQDNKLEGIGFNNLLTSNIKSTTPWINHVQASSFEIPQYRLLKIAGYQATIDGITLQDVSAENDNPAGSKLAIKYRFNFDLLENYGFLGIQGNSCLDILAVPDAMPASRFTQHLAHLQEIPINWVPFGNYADHTLSVRGNVNYTNGSSGYEYQGNIEAWLFEHRATINARMGITNDRRYWAFAGEYASPDPISLGFAGLATHAFGGGVYYNMEKPTVTANGASVTDIEFEPPHDHAFNNFGVMLSTILLNTSPDLTNTSDTDGDVFNGRFLMEVDFRDGGLEQIRLSGLSHLMATDLPANYWINNTTYSPEAPFVIDAEIAFNWPNKSLAATAGYRLNLNNGLVTGQGDDVVDLLINPNEWHIYLGQRNNRLNAQLNILSDPIEVDAYFTLEGRTDDWTSAFESLQVGLRGGFNLQTRDYHVPLTVADEIRLAAWVNFDLEGGFGFNTTFCSNHPDDEFFIFLTAGLNLGFGGEYWESSESIFPYLVVNDGWDDWESFTRWDVSSSISIFAPNPSGLSMSLGVDIPFWERKYFTFRLGQTCQ